jgi:S-adenosylmethionine:tRNA ribosyltransferase-isomerase
MKLSQFKFDLPLNLIAQNPAKKREDARMMVVNRKTGNDGKQALPRYP